MMEDDESFHLLSSMSPNVKQCQRHYRKGTSIIALRKSLRKSSIYDKSIHTEKNDNLIITEVSSTTTSESKSSKSSKSHDKLVNKTPIIIIDDSDSDNEVNIISSKNKSLERAKQDKKLVKKGKKSSFLSQDQFENIKHWIDNVNLQSEPKDSSVLSAYSELSTIYGEENGKNFITQRTGRAVNSTVIGSTFINFDELFKEKTQKADDMPRQDCKDSDEPSVIDESYIKQETNTSRKSEGSDGGRCTIFTIDETDFISNSVKSVISSSSKEKEYLNSDKIDKLSADSCKSVNDVYTRHTNKDCVEIKVSKSDEDIVKDSDNSFSLNESLRTRLAKNKNSTDASTKYSQSSNKYSNGNRYSENNLDGTVKGNDTANTNEEELASMLDDIYGEKWREKEEHVLFKTPKTEPKKRAPKLSNICITNSEQKPKLSVLYKNPYLETEKLKSNNLLRTLQKSRLKNIESPVVKRLNDFCDSDTDSNISDGQTKPRTKLNFNESDCDEDVPKTTNNVKKKTTSKYFTDTGRTNKKTVLETESKKGTESDKENFDDSFLGQSLEDRIRKKIFGMDICEGKKKEKKRLDDKRSLTKKSNSDLKVDKKVNNFIKKGEKKTDRKLSRDSDSSSDDTWEEEISKIVHDTKPVNGKYSFLESLSANIPILQCDMSARIFRNNFKSYKEQLLTKLFNLYNEKVFENAIPPDTVLEWNDRMRGTAGFCYCKKVTRRTGAVERTARIVLSTKVIDAAYRLRDTLIHEMCHAATWIVNCISDGHGPYWKSWAYKAMKTFPELPPIKRCHDYVINTKYTYKCTRCGYSIGRHSKSLDIERKRCGYCLGKFEVLLNKVSKKGETKSVPATPKKEATGFALFVKENYSVYKQTNLKHGDVMKLLGQKFQEMKLKTN